MDSFGLNALQLSVLLGLRDQVIVCCENGCEGIKSMVDGIPSAK